MASENMGASVPDQALAASPPSPVPGLARSGFDPSRVVQCPASMCPLIAKDGSPWTGQFAAPCPGKGLDSDTGDGCPWWDLACSCGGIQHLVEQAAVDGGRAVVAGPNKPRRLTGGPRHFDCERASVCRWQEQAAIAGRKLCPPRDALARGLDPRVCLF